MHGLHFQLAIPFLAASGSTATAALATDAAPQHLYRCGRLAQLRSCGGPELHLQCACRARSADGPAPHSFGGAGQWTPPAPPFTTWSPLSSKANTTPQSPHKSLVLRRNASKGHAPCPGRPMGSLQSERPQRRAHCRRTKQPDIVRRGARGGPDPPQISLRQAGPSAASRRLGPGRPTSTASPSSSSPPPSPLPTLSQSESPSAGPSPASCSRRGQPSVTPTGLGEGRGLAGMQGGGAAGQKRLRAESGSCGE